MTGTLTSRISVRTNPADPATEIGTHRPDGAGAATSPAPSGPGTTGMTLQQAVFAGLVHPGNLVAVRDISDGRRRRHGHRHRGVLRGRASTYTITRNANGSITVDSNGGADGVDTLWNIENLRFCRDRPGDQGLHRLPGRGSATVVAPASPPGGLGVRRALAFATQNVATTSAAQAITVSNTGNAALVVSGVTVTGTDAASFTATPVAGCASVAPGASCTVNVTFAPTTAGAKTATVNIADNAAW